MVTTKGKFNLKLGIVKSGNISVNPVTGKWRYVSATGNAGADFVSMEVRDESATLGRRVLNLVKERLRIVQIGERFTQVWED